jgi:hypothetical protein
MCLFILLHNPYNTQTILTTRFLEKFVKKAFDSFLNPRLRGTEWKKYPLETFVGRDGSGASILDSSQGIPPLMDGDGEGYPS